MTFVLSGFLSGVLIGFLLLCSILVGTLIAYVSHLDRLLP